MKLKKGSAAAKAFMAKLRAKKGKLKNKKDIPDRGYKKITLDFLPIKKIGASFDSGSFKVLGKKNNQLVEISESPMTYEDAKKFIKNEGIEKYYSNVDIVPYRGAKKTTKYIGSKLKLNPKEKRLGAVDKDLKTRAKTYHKDTKSHNVKISVVSGIGTVTQKLEKSLEWINFYTDQLNWWKNYKPKNIYERKGKTDSIKFYTKSLSNEKKHLASIKKTI